MHIPECSQVENVCEDYVVASSILFLGPGSELDNLEVHSLIFDCRCTGRVGIRCSMVRHVSNANARCLLYRRIRKTLSA